MQNTGVTDEIILCIEDQSSGQDGTRLPICTPTGLARAP